MRDLDNRGLINGDFLLVSGDVVSNLPIEHALARHRGRREKDKNAIMTMVLREAGTQHRTKSRGRKPVFVINPAVDRCLHYEEMSHRRRGDHYLSLDPELLKENEQIDVREDLIDCYIDICTPDVLSLWSDNFDYQTLRKSFLFGVLKDYELNGKTIHTHIIKEHYAARVRSLRAYDSVSKDIISRWTYPLCPDSNLVGGQSYRLGHSKVYQEENVILARASTLKSRTVVGKGTSIGNGSVIGDSVLGRRCQIGKNVTIHGAYVWDDAVIGDGSIIKQAVVANEAVIGRNCTIEPGALISYRVRIADNSTIPGANRITTAKQSGREPISNQSDPSLVGHSGDGYAYTSDANDASDASSSSEWSSHLIYLQKPSETSSQSSISTIGSSISEAIATRETEDTSRRSSFRSDPSAEEDADKETIQTQRDFHHEATASILDGLSKGDSPDVIHLELLSQRLSANANDHMMRSALVSAFVKRIVALAESDQSVIGTSEAVGKTLKSYAELITQMAIFDKDGSGSERPDQVDFLMLVQKELVSKSKGRELLLFFVKECYSLEIVEEEGILGWWVDGRSAEGEMGALRGLVVQFVDWLKEAESEDDDEEEDEDEEDDDE